MGVSTEKSSIESVPLDFILVSCSLRHRGEITGVCAGKFNVEVNKMR